MRLVILGGAGDGFSLAEAARLAAAAGAPYSLHGFLNDNVGSSESLYGLPVLGRFEDWRTLDEDIVFCPAIQKVLDMPRRVRRIEELGIPADRWMTVRHPQCAVASTATVGRGCFIASFVTIQPGVCVGDFSTIRSGASIGHDAVLADHASVAPNATMCGRSRLMRGAHLGAGAVILNSKSVGSFAVVGVGAAVTKDVRDCVVVMGNPARRVRFPQAATESGAPRS